MAVAQIVKWGNSLAIRIPKTVAQEAKIEEGDPVVISGSPGAIEVRRTHAVPSLQELVAQITPENRYQEIPTRERGRERVEW